MATARESRGRVRGVLLMSFGTAETVGDVPAYLANVRGGRAAPSELVEEFQRRFARVGGSPLTRITREQAAALEDQLNRYGRETIYCVRAGMRNAPPFIAEALVELADERAEDIVGIVLSPQYSPTILGEYLRAVENARAMLPPHVRIRVAGAWHDEPAFLDALAERVNQALADLTPEQRLRIPVIFTAHSLPQHVAEGEPEYLAQLQMTADAVAKRTRIATDRWRFAYQSAGHTPEPWLTPDVKDLLPEYRVRGHDAVLVVPVQFLADHLEILYDIDVAAREEAAELGIALLRPQSLNTLPRFIEALANVVRREFVEVAS